MFVVLGCAWLFVAPKKATAATVCTTGGALVRDNWGPPLNGWFCSFISSFAQALCQNQRAQICQDACAACGAIYNGVNYCTWQNSPGPAPDDPTAYYYGCPTNYYAEFFEDSCICIYCTGANGCHAGADWRWDPSNCVDGEGDDGCGCCYSSTPIVVSLRGDHVRLSSASDGVVFDFFGDGHPQRYAWPVDSDDAWLVIDRNHNGQVDDGTELFGNASLLSNGEHARNGYQLLAELDENHDGVVNQLDPGFGQILLWRDKIRNGHVDPGELIRAVDAGITGFAIRYDESRRTDEWGNVFRYRSNVFFGHAPFERRSFDVFLTSAQP